MFTSSEPLVNVVNIYTSSLMGGLVYGISYCILIDSYSKRYIFSIRYGSSERILYALVLWEHLIHGYNLFIFYSVVLALFNLLL